MSLFKRNGKKKKEPEADKIPRTLAPPSGYRADILSYHIGNLQGIGARERQEDAFCIVNAFDTVKMRENGLFFAVCDGMGGMKDGRLASETAASVLKDAFERLDREDDIAAALRRAVGRASGEVETLLDGDGGSTVVGGVIYHDSFYYVSVGDSALYLKRENHLYRLNHKHNLCHEIYLEDIRKGIVDPAHGRGDPESTALTSFLGMRGSYPIDASVRPLPMKEGDVLLTCSDGVSEILSEAEILASLDTDDPSQMCQRLEDGIIGHFDPHQDNYTAVAVKCF